MTLNMDSDGHNATPLLSSSDLDQLTEALLDQTEARHGLDEPAEPSPAGDQVEVVDGAISAQSQGVAHDAVLIVGPEIVTVTENGTQSTNGVLQPLQSGGPSPLKRTLYGIFPSNNH
ncbi:unnamed protein product [Rhizoctonia solani]|uniref:Uncharacterized protein n=1 Tax=Rhizoctonia solani TaxID=456999 RepID=A0A8H3DH72_9AGAM|nr:unnamed protein product [Rhizoctonia solani]